MPRDSSNPDQPRPKVLMIAYACNPAGTGEHWLGWGWAEQAARRYDVHLITTPNAQAQVAEAAPLHGITPHFVEQPAGGKWGRKFGWQKRVLDFASALHAQERFALVHQTTFHTFRVPFLAANLGIPSVWGPVAGGESAPPGFGRVLGPARFSEAWRNWVNRAWLLYPPVRRSLAQSTRLFVSNRTTLSFLPACVRAKCEIVPPNALSREDELFTPPVRGPRPAGPLRLVYAGNCVATRGLPLIFAAMREADAGQFELTIAGTGPALEFWKRETARLGLGRQVKFLGQVPKAQLPEIYAASDLLVFPALRDSGGSALLEAMARGLTVLCLDWSGPGEMVDESCGFKIPVTTEAETVSRIAQALLRAGNEPGLCPALAAAARRRAESAFRWEAKFQLLVRTYDQLISTP